MIPKHEFEHDAKLEIEARVCESDREENDYRDRGRLGLFALRVGY